MILKPKLVPEMGVLRLLVMVTDSGALSVLSAWLPNGSVAGATVTGCTPVPVILTVRGTVSPVPPIVNVAACGPRPAGVNAGAGMGWN